MSSPLKHLRDEVESLAGSPDALEIEPSWPANDPAELDNPYHLGIRLGLLATVVAALAVAS